MNENLQYMRISTPVCVEDFTFTDCVLLMGDARGLLHGRLRRDGDGYVLFRVDTGGGEVEVARYAGGERVREFLERCGCLGGFFRGLRAWFCVGLSGHGLRLDGAYLDCLVTDGLGIWRVGARCGAWVCLYRVCGDGESMVRVTDGSWGVISAPDTACVTAGMVREMWGIPAGVGVFYCDVED